MVTMVVSFDPWNRTGRGGSDAGKNEKPTHEGHKTRDAPRPEWSAAGHQAVVVVVVVLCMIRVPAYL
jgi:hypothetical protein